MPELTGGSERVDLGSGITLSAPGLHGQAELLNGGGDSRDMRAAEESTELLDDVLRRVDMRSLETVEILASDLPGSRGASGLRDANDQDAMLLEVPDLGPEVGEVVMSVDEMGAITWHFALENGQAPQPGAARGSDTRRFLIRRDAPVPPPGTRVGDDRALFGSLGRKLLKVLVYPITDLLVGKSARAIAEHWEKANRTYGLRTFTPQNYQQQTSTAAERAAVALGAADAERLEQGRALLMLHGTFSTAHGAFHDMPRDLVATLHQRYDGRVLAFNHFSLSHDPKRNVRELLTMMQAVNPDGALEVDVISHSRGGLVARTLAEGGTLGLGTDRFMVRRAVFVGVPNAGTQLANPDHMVSMIDRLTTGLNLVPPGGVADVLEGILIGVKIIGHGALKGLDGLRAMDPAGDFLKELNRGGTPDAEFFAVAANYEPTDTGLRSIVSGAVDKVVDRIFADAENDLVVPENGVYSANGCDSFPVKTERCLRLKSDVGVMHTGMFGNADVARSIGTWLQ